MQDMKKLFVVLQHANQLVEMSALADTASRNPAVWLQS